MRLLFSLRSEKSLVLIFVSGLLKPLQDPLSGLMHTIYPNVLSNEWKLGTELVDQVMVERPGSHLEIGPSKLLLQERLMRLIEVTRQDNLIEITEVQLHTKIHEEGLQRPLIILGLLLCDSDQDRAYLLT